MVRGERYLVSAESLAQQCLSCIARHLSSIPLPSLSNELRQDIISNIIQDRTLTKRDGTYLCRFWTLTLIKLFPPNSLQPLSLDLSSSSLLDSHLAFIISLCPSLTSLNLSRNNLITRDTITNLSDLRSLTYLNLSHCTSAVDIRCLEVLSTIGGNLEWLSLEHCDLMNYAFCPFDSICTCTNLRSLNLANSVVLDDTVRKVATSCLKLKVLNLKNCHLISDNSISLLFSKTISLEVVNLKNCKRISNRSFDNFACSSLSHLNINFCEKVSTNSLLIVMAISENLHTIKAFKIKIRGNRYKFSDFIKSCQQVRNLNIAAGALSFTSRTLSDIRVCTNLTSLTLGDPLAPSTSGALAPQVVESTFGSLNQLEKLKLYSITVNSETLRIISKFCPLKCLVLHWCDFDGRVTGMVAFGFPYLEKLVIDVRITGAPPPLDFSKFPHLVNVKLAGNFPLDDSVIFSMTQQLKHLQCLDLGNVCGPLATVTNEGLATIGRSVHLRKLDVSNFQTLTPRAVHALLRHRSAGGLARLQKLTWSPNRTTLQLAHVHWMNDLHVIQLIDSLPSLHTLSIVCCTDVTGEFLVVTDANLKIYLSSGKVMMRGDSYDA